MADLGLTPCNTKMILSASFLYYKMKLGRPKMLSERKKTEVVVVRLRAEDRKLIEEAAERSSKGLSAWMRDSLISAASRRGKNR
jgi:hypothetical protein